MKKASLLISIVLIPLALTSCTNKQKIHLKSIADGTGFTNLTNAKVLFYYANLTGMDSSGPLYYVLDYSGVDETIRFENIKEKDRAFVDGRNNDFESIVNTFITDEIADDYTSFGDEYKIDWNKPYKYYSSIKEYIGTALIYYQDNNLLFALKLKM